MTKAEKNAVELVKCHGTTISYALRIYADLLKDEGYKMDVMIVNEVAEKVSDAFLRLVDEG